MPTVRLSEQQRERARDVAQVIAEHPSCGPHEFVDQWTAKPSVADRDLIEEYETEVPVREIIGVAKQNTDRLVPRRLNAILKKLHNQEYTKPLPSEPHTPPHLERLDGSYYVSTDGIHRTLAHKILEIETLYAKVTVYR